MVNLARKLFGPIEWRSPYVWVPLTAIALHLVLVLYYLPPSVIFGNHPISWGDYPIKFTEAFEVGQTENPLWRTWAYTPSHLAGYPAGVYTAVGGQVYTLFVMATKAFLSPVTAFNICLFLLFFLAPLLILLAGKFLGFSQKSRVILLVWTLVTWHLESHLRYMWTTGTTAFLAASFLAVIAGASYMNLVSGLSKTSLSTLVKKSLLLGLLAGLVVVVHPLASFVLAALLIGPFIYHLTAKRPCRLIPSLLPATLILVLLNLFWLVPFFQLTENYIGGYAGPLSTSLNIFLTGIIADIIVRNFARYRSPGVGKKLTTTTMTSMPPPSY